jgi:hypothetical protein
MALLWATQPVSAQIVYEFADSAGNAQTSFTVPAGGTISIKVFIHELTAGAPTLNSQGGLATGAVRVRFNNPAGIAAVLTNGDITAAVPPWNGGTGVVDTGANANTAKLSDLTLFSGVLPTNGRIEIGTFLFHALVPGSTTLAAVDPNPGAGFDTSSFNTTGGVPNIDYDPLLVPGSANLTVTGVPEPTSLVLAGLAAVGMAIRRRRNAKLANLAV